MSNLLEYLKMLKEDEIEEDLIEEELDYNLYANYVPTLRIFNDVLGNGRILSNYEQWNKQSKDFDVRGNHICLTHDVLNLPKIMPALQYGVVFNRNELDDLVNTKSVGIVNPVSKFIIGKEEDKDKFVIDDHSDSRYRRYKGEIINGKKNTSMALLVRGILETNNGVKWLLLKQWTDRNFPLKRKNPEMSEKELQASDSLFNKIVKAFEQQLKINNYSDAYIKENNQEVPSKINFLYPLGEYANTEKYKEYQDKYINLSNIKKGYILGRNNILPASISEPLCLKFKSKLVNGEEYSELQGKGFSIELTPEEIYILDEYILNEHEKRLYLKNVKNIGTKTNPQLENPEDMYFYFKGGPRQLEINNILNKVVLPDVSILRLSDIEELETNITDKAASMIRFNLKYAFTTYKGSSAHIDQKLFQLRQLNSLKNNPNKSQYNYTNEQWNKFLSYTKTNIQQMYLALRYGNLTTPKKAVLDNPDKIENSVRYYDTKVKRILIELDELLKFKEILKFYDNLPVKWYHKNIDEDNLVDIDYLQD